MKTRFRTFVPVILIVSLLMLDGCARRHRVRYPPPQPSAPEQGQTVRPERERQTPAIQEKELGPGREQPREEREEGLGPALKAQKGPAQGLYRDAEHAMDKGDYKRAEALLERALRVEPKNGWYWHAMGRVQYAQGSYDQAIQFCLKSNTLAGRDSELQRDNRILLQKASRKKEAR